MITNNLSNLKIHKLTQEQYDRERNAGRLDENALYLTPDDPLVADETLSVPGQAADAKAVGDALATKQPVGDYALQSDIDGLGALATKDTVSKSDLASDVQASLGKADTAIQSIDGLATETYVDGKIAAIPTPDVSGQINTHNTSTDAHSDIRTQLNKKANDFSIEIYNGTSGNPKPVRFASFNYSSCNSENGISAKISLVSGHGNGTSYAFLEDAIIRVGHTGTVEVDNFKYYGAATGTYDGASRQYGDIFWLVDETNKIVDFYCLMGQYARVYQTPWKRLTHSSGGTVTQHTSCTVYSSGDKAWANNSEYATKSDIAAIPTPDVSGQINAHASDSNAHGDIRDEVGALSDRLNALESSVVTVHSGDVEPVSTMGENGDLYLYTGA